MIWYSQSVDTNIPNIGEIDVTEAMPPSLTPPSAEKPKRTRKAKDPNAPVKERTPRKDYGYKADAVISLVEGKEIKYREGNRLNWYNSVKEFAGKTVKEWEETRKGEKDPPRGWLRFFVQDGAVTLSTVQ